jgi:hypothetical protein
MRIWYRAGKSRSVWVGKWMPRDLAQHDIAALTHVHTEPGDQAILGTESAA